MRSVGRSGRQLELSSSRSKSATLTRLSLTFPARERSLATHQEFDFRLRSSNSSLGSSVNQPKKRRRALFVSYDGLSDPIATSQIFPYLFGLAEKGWEI